MIAPPRPIRYGKCNIPNEIVVLAVAHLHRKPNYWRSRLSGPNP